MKKKSLLIILSCILLVIAAACSSSESSNSKELNSLEQIKDAGKVVIGTTGNYRPYSYMDSNNQLTGYDIEWGEIIAQELGVEAEFITGQFAGLLPGLSAGRFDIILSGVNITEERKQSIDFSIPYSMDGTVAVIKKGSNALQDITDIEGKIVGVNAGSAFDAAVREIGGYKELREYPGAAESFSDLIAGRIDVVAIGMISAGEYMLNSSQGDQIEVVGEPYDIKNVGIAMKKNSPELEAEINKIIQSKKSDGTYAELTEKYFGTIFDN
jgi:ABC-type amino acid transport substrate-binding protein